MQNVKTVIQENLDFGTAWALLLKENELNLSPGATVIIERMGWNGADQYVRAIYPQAPHPSDSPDAQPQNPYFRMADNNAAADGTFAPFAVIKTTQNKVFPWTPSQGDLFGKDYRVSVMETNNG